MHRKTLTRFALALMMIAALLSASLILTGSASAAGSYAGYVYTESNAPGGNQVLVFGRAADGALTPLNAISTGGAGTGAGLGSEGALAQSDNGQWLLAVNAGSNDVSVISVKDGAMTDKAASGGAMPISVTLYKGLVYVLNGGGTPNISGFWLSKDGHLTSIPGSTRPLGGTAPAQVSFSTDGQALVVTEKGSNTIDTYTVDEDGLANGPITHASHGAVPFGFDFGKHNILIVSEAPGSAASSYQVNDDGALNLVTGSLANGQQAACWVIITNNGQIAYTANAHNGTISSYGVARDGSLTLMQAVAGQPGGTPLDEAMSRNDRFLFVLNPGMSAINAFGTHPDGTLDALSGAIGIPASAAGLVAR